MATKMASLAIQRLPRPSHVLVTRHVSRILSVQTSRNNLTWRSLSSGIESGSSSGSTTKPGSQSESIPSATSAAAPEEKVFTKFEADEQSSPDRIAQETFKRLKGTVIERSQILDANQLQKLCITLNRKDLAPGQDMTKGPPVQGTHIPPGYHLVYFTPSDLESELGADGTDQTFSPPAPFSRRMWSGGIVQWNPENPLRVGDLVTEKTRLLGVSTKVDRDGKPMLLAKVGKVFYNKKAWAVKEERSWLFLKPFEIDPTKSVQGKPKSGLRPPSMVMDIASQPFPVRVLRWSTRALFRFSALTFNAHMIHYNDPYTKDIEGRSGIVVHGPLNLINMMDYWRDVHGQDGKVQPVEVKYRATSPVHATERYHILTTSTPSGSTAGSAGNELADQESTLLNSLEYRLLLAKGKRTTGPPFERKSVNIMTGNVRAIPTGNNSLGDCLLG